MPNFDVRDTMADCPRCHGDGTTIDVKTNLVVTCPNCKGEKKTTNWSIIGVGLSIIGLLTIGIG